MSGLLAGLVKDAFKVLSQVDSDLTVSATYRSLTSTNADSYNPTTGVVAAVYQTITIVDAVFSKFRQRQTDSLTVVDNRAFLIFSADQMLNIPTIIPPATDPVPVNYEPQINDTVTIGGVVWNVQDVEFPPGTSLYKLLIRKA